MPGAGIRPWLAWAPSGCPSTAQRQLMPKAQCLMPKWTTSMPLADTSGDDRVVEITAKLRVDGVRLDQFLVSQFSDFSRSVVQRVIEANGVEVNGKPAKASYRVRHGD